MKRKTFTKTALVISILLMFLWFFLGVYSSIAWFKDSDTVVNHFYFGEFSLNVEYLDKTSGEYKELKGSTRVFDDQALYEPGYIQIVPLRVTNTGEIDFKYEVAVDVNDRTVATNVFGNPFYLDHYLKCGAVFGSTEEEVARQIDTREKVKASVLFQNLQSTPDFLNGSVLPAKETGYAALILTMPETVGNEANYRGGTIPEVELGVEVVATQVHD